jgi:hypothetical protein
MNMLRTPQAEHNSTQIGSRARSIRTARRSPVSHFQAVLWFAFGLFAAMLLLALPSCAQNTPEGEGIDIGNYEVRQRIEAGYRLNEIGGNISTYSTFVNLGPGFRLFDYTLDMRSLNHQGLLFDNFSFNNFGYGGDPNNVSRLRIQKNKWYDFRALFRRDKNFWNYNLWANPLNPISTDPATSPTTPIAFSPHALDLVRRVQNYDLTLLPESRVRFRLGYSRNRDEGPGFFTTDGGTISAFPEVFSYTTNAYRAGIDVLVLPRTTLSYDQFLNYFRQNNRVTDNPLVAPGNFGFQFSNRTPVDMGIIWANSGGEILPCAAPIINAATTPPTVAADCNGFVSYTQTGLLHNFMPTERFRFQSNYFRNLEMSGSIGYSTANSVINNFNEVVVGWTTRDSSPGGTTAGPANAKRVSVNAVGSLFTIGGTGLGAPLGAFFPANCNASNDYNGLTCPSHTSSSSADLTSAINSNFLKQDLKSNTFQIKYDFTRRFSGHIGYMYTHREIVSSAFKFTTQEVYYPGGSSGSVANDFLAARGDCAATGAGVPPSLPTGCVLNADGSVTFTAPPPTGAPSFEFLGINENALILGMVARPTDTLRLTSDLAFGYNDHSYTRVSPRQVQTYRISVNYSPQAWANVNGAIDIGENRDNVYTVNSLEHDRMYSFMTSLTANSRLSVNFGYNYWDVYSQAGICYSVGFGPPPSGTTPCPTASSSVPLGALAVYTNNTHYAYAGFVWKANRRVTAALSFAGSFVRGTSPYFDQPQFATSAAPPLQQVTLNPLTPDGTLAFNYLQPNGSITIDVYRGLSYKMAWNYYGFNQQGNTNPSGLATIPLQDFNGSNATFGFRYSF